MIYIMGAYWCNLSVYIECYMTYTARLPRIANYGSHKELEVPHEGRVC